MKRDNAHVIYRVEPGSIADELEMAPGDILLSINGEPLEDVLDYRFLIQNEELTLLIEKKDGTQEEWEIEKDYYEDLGIEFESGLMSEYRRCSNRCIFCFIDQMPPGMRDTLYFKDDDARLSFLQGNYITMTNMKEKDLERIVRYHLSPINISVHTTNPALRVKMLGNRFAGSIMEKLLFLKDGGITMNSQIVLCKGINDKKELERTISDLSRLCPRMQSLSVVPVGLTKFRKDLYPLEPFKPEDAAEVIDMVEGFQEKMMKEYGSHFVHASDEFYILAGRDIPEEEQYDGYVQLENGVGMVRLLLNGADEALKSLTGDGRSRSVSIAVGTLIFPYIRGIADKVMEMFPNVRVFVYPVINTFFGESITVTGLITGKCLLEQLPGKNLGERLLRF